MNCSTNGCTNQADPYFAYEVEGKVSEFGWCWKCWRRYVWAVMSQMVKMFV